MKRPFLCCLEGWIIGESLAFLLGEKETAVAASIFVSVVLFVLAMMQKNRSRFFTTDNGKKCKIIKRYFFFWYVFALFACFRVGSVERESNFYTKIRREKSSFLAVDGKIKSQKKSQSGNALVLSDCTFFLEGEKIKAKDKIIVYGVKREYLMGQRIQVRGDFSFQQTPTNPGEFHSYIYYRARGINGSLFCDKVERVYGRYHPILELARRIQINFQKIYSILFSEEEAGILSAMVLGEKSQLSQEIKLLYQENGISHILAISGLHVSFLGMNLYKRLRKCCLSFFSSAFFSSVFLLFYGCVTGFSHSALRAIFMLCISFLADVLGRCYDLVSSVSFTAIFMLVLYPYCLFDASFLLSFGAVFGIGLLLPLLEEFQKSKENKRTKEKIWAIKLRKSVINSLLGSIAIQIITLPILLYFYYEVSVYGIFINVCILPLLPFLLLFAILAGIFGSFFLEIGKCFAVFAGLILKFYKIIASLFGKLPFSKWTVGKIGILGYLFYIIGVGIYVSLMYMEQKKRKNWETSYLQEGESEFLFGENLVLKSLRVGVLLLAFFLLFWNENREKNFRLIMLDVGQGDGILMEFPDGTSCMIDGGSSSKSKIGSYVLLPALKYYGMSKLDYVFVSHEDSDHVSGLIELFESEYRIKNLILPYREEKEKAENYEKLIYLAKARGSNLIHFKKGDIMKKGEVSFSCLHPREEGQEGDVNADSMVLSMEYKNFRALLTGDLAEGGEDALVEELKKRKEESYTLLKVAHHGSKKSTLEPLLALVNPRVSLISCSATNRYGHPGKETLERLREAGSEIYITKDVGAIEFRIREEGIEIKTFI